MTRVLPAMFSRFFVGLLFALYIAAAPAALAGPRNDNFAEATLITGHQTRLESETTVGATVEPEERSHGRTLPKHSVWYQFTAQTGGSVRVTIVDTINIHASLYSGSNWDSLRAVSQTAGDAAGDIETLSAFVREGETISLAVDSSIEGEFQMEFRFEAVANDFFSQATLLTGGEGTEIAKGYENNGKASLEFGEPAHGAASGKSMWYRWTAPATGAIIFDTLGSAFDTVLAVYTGDAIDSLSLVGSNDNTVGFTSRVQFNAVAGRTYHIAVAGANRGGAIQHGDFYLHYYPPNGVGGPMLDLAQPLVASEDSSVITVRVLRVRGTSGAGSFSYDARSATATAGVDFIAVNGVMSIGPNQKSVTFDIPIIDDSELEAMETIYVNVYPSDGIPSSFATARILDNEHPVNDGFTSPNPLVGSFGSFPVVNYGATVESGEPITSESLPGITFTRSLWFKWTAPADGIVEWRGINEMSLAIPVPPVLQLYSGPSLDQLQTPAHAELTLDTSGPQHRSRLRTRVTAGTEYRVQCATSGSEDAAGTVSWKYLDPSIFSFKTPTITANESDGTVAMTIFRINGINDAATVRLRTISGTATAPDDFEHWEGTLITFPAGSSTAVVYLSLQNDHQAENDETFTIELFDPSPFAALGSDATATITIRDDDIAGELGFLEAGGVVREDSGSIIINVHRVNGTDGVVSIEYSTVEGSAKAGQDFEPVAGVLTFAHGETEKTIAVTLLNDSVFENRETFQVVLSNPGGGAVLGSASFTVKIADDELFVPRKAHYAVTLPAREGEPRMGLLSFDSLVSGKLTGQLRFGSESFRFRGTLDESGGDYSSPRRRW